MSCEVCKFTTDRPCNALFLTLCEGYWQDGKGLQPLQASDGDLGKFSYLLFFSSLILKFWHMHWICMYNVCRWFVTSSRHWVNWSGFDFLFNSPQQGNTPAKEQSIFITAYEADVSSDRTVYTHIQMLFRCFENPIGQRCLNWFQQKLFCYGCCKKKEV